MARDHRVERPLVALAQRVLKVWAGGSTRLMAFSLGQFHFSSGRLIRRGGLGEAHEIEVTASNSTHSIGRKLAKNRLNEQWRDHPAMRERFEREIRAVKDMQNPAIVPFEGENVSDGHERLCVMPLYAQSARDLLKTSLPGLQLVWVAGIVAILADALRIFD